MPKACKEQGKAKGYAQGLGGEVAMQRPEEHDTIIGKIREIAETHGNFMRTDCLTHYMGQHTSPDWYTCLEELANSRYLRRVETEGVEGNHIVYHLAYFNPQV